MKYKDTIQYLFNLQYSGIKLGLDNTFKLLDYWDNPQNKWPAIHIAGTNGKGSTAAFIYSILKSAGYKVGLYTSPHLIDFSERIRVNDKKILWDEIVQYTSNLKPKIESYKPTFFEATTVIAFKYFADQQVDMVVVETGLGGRLDATNVVNPLVTVITPLSLDHQQYLGSEISQIAQEKAGIIKPGVPCITNNSIPGIVSILETKCIEKNAPFSKINPEQSIEILSSSLNGARFTFQFNKFSYQNLEICLAGTHQVRNAATAIAAVQAQDVFPVKEKSVRGGLIDTYWPARLQIIQKEPLVILDVAHNAESFTNVLRFLSEKLHQRNLHIILGLAKDKDAESIVSVLKNDVSRLAIISNFSDRGMEPAKLIESLDSANLNYQVFDKLMEGFSHMLETSRSNDVILIIGSHYLAGEFLKKYKILDLNK